MAGFDHGRVPLGSGFEGAQHHRRLASFRPADTGINALLIQAGPALRARSRYLTRNNPYMKRAKRVFVTYAIGTGIRPIPLAQKLTAAVGRAYAYDCDADVGDSRCGINCNAAAFKGNGTVSSAIDARRFSASGLTAFADTWFTGGKLTWVTGANAGLAMEVKRYGKGASAGVFELWQPMPKAVSAGDTFTVTVGCDKTFATCKAKFNNAANFQGFPYIPGNDTTISYPTSTQALDGGSRYGN